MGGSSPGALAGARSAPEAGQGAAPIVPGWTEPLLEKTYADDDCGCPVEEWIHRGINLTLHFEPDGSLELFADAGDWVSTIALKARTMEEARGEAFAWVDALPYEDR